MADSTASIDTATAGKPTTTDTAGKDGVQFEAITSQEELDRIIQTRLARERAKYADCDALKAKSAKWDEAEEADKTELQKAVERAEKAEADLSASQVSAQRLEAIAKYQIPEEYQVLITATDPEGIEAKAAKLGELAKPKGPIMPTQERQPTAIPGGETDWIRAGFRGRATLANASNRTS